jgi:hypothetical protein
VSTLLDLLRVTPGPPEAVRVAMLQMDEDEFVAKCARHGLSGLAHHELRQSGIVLSAPAAATLKRDAMSIAVTGIKVKKLLFKSLEAFSHHGVRPVLLKGYGLAHRCYPDPLFRPMTDVDLLVSRDELQAAETALAEIGLRKNEELEDYQLHHHHHLNFYGTSGSVELHFRAISGFGGAIEADGLLQRAIEADLEGHPVRYLRAEDEIAYLATHATQHLFKGVGWLYDLKLFIERHLNLEWSAVIAAARESKMHGPVYFALRTARIAMNANVPEWVLDELRPFAWQVFLGGFLFSEKRLVDSNFAEFKYSWIAAPFLASNFWRTSRAALHLAWRAPLRKLARHFPTLAPAHWRA